MTQRWSKVIIGLDHMTQRRRDRAYTGTCNNPEGEPDFTATTSKVKYCVWQLEVGESGTEHFQWSIHFVNAITLKSARTALNAIFGKSCHVEVTQDLNASYHYCKKPVEGCQCEHCRGATRLEGPWEYGSVPDNQGARTDLKDLVVELKKKRSIAEVLKDDVLNYKVGRCLTWATAIIEANQGNQDEYQDRLVYDDLWTYQKKVVDIVRDEHPKRRRIFWVHSDEPNTGKSTLARYLQEMHDACLMSVDASAQNLLARYLQFYHGERVIVIDIPRSIDVRDIEKFYYLCEKLSDGGVMGGGFGQSKPVNVCAHIVVCSNLIVPGHTLLNRCIDIEALRDS